MQREINRGVTGLSNASTDLSRYPELGDQRVLQGLMDAMEGVTGGGRGVHHGALLRAGAAGGHAGHRGGWLGAHLAVPQTHRVRRHHAASRDHSPRPEPQNRIRALSSLVQAPQGFRAPKHGV